MARIFRLHSNPHQEIIELLPWHVAGQLEPADAARVEAHLETCTDCQAEMAIERRLKAGVASQSLEVEHGWAAMRAQIAAEGRPARRAPDDRRPSGARQGLRWAIAAQIAIVVALVAAVAPSHRPAPDDHAAYHTLSAPRPAAAGDFVVVFRPETREAALRQTLQFADARIVDGPTATDAYVLQAAPGRRAQALARLRGAPDVLLAQPLDPNGAP